MSQSRTTQENGLAAIVSSFLWGQPIDTDFWYFRQEARILRPRMRKEVVLPSGLILATQMHASFRMSSRSVKKSYRSLAIFELARQSVKIFGPGRIQEDQASFRTPCGMI
jgi:hypothetical protein